MEVQYFDALNSGTSNARHALIDINDIYLDENNPRFAAATLISNAKTTSQQSVINYMLQYCNLKGLGDSICQNGGLYLEDTISCYLADDGKFVVVEGNRRIATCKILLDKTLVPKDLESLAPHISAVNGEKETMTRQNIGKVKAVVYTNLDEARKYITARHTSPEIKKWEPFEQYNYYYAQFSSGTSLLNLNTNVSDVRNKVRDFAVFKNIFSILKTKYPAILMQGSYLLPITRKFLPHLLGNDSEIGLNVEISEDTLEYIPAPSKIELYNKILLMVGEAFFVRPEAKTKNEQKCLRPNSDIFRVATSEIGNLSSVKQLVLSDVRIPGLINLIHQYTGFSFSVLSTANQHQNFEYKSASDKLQPTSNCKNRLDTQTSNAHSNDDQVSFTSTLPDVSSANSQNKDKRTITYPVSVTTEPEFFSNLAYEHIDRSNPQNIGLCRVCEEIKLISTYHSNIGYKKFPIASTFLLRSLIEQVLIRQEKKCQCYRPDTSTTGIEKTPKLENIIAFFNKQSINSNYKFFNDDAMLAKNFHLVFTGLGTKDQLDTVIHSPHKIDPDSKFLNSFVKQGLFDVIQGFLNGF